MHAIRMNAFGGPEVLERCTMPVPEPGDGEVLVRVAAAGVNYADLRMRSGEYPVSPPLPVVPGFELSGLVEAVGPGAASRALDPRVLQPGTAVVAAHANGAYADYALVPADMLLPVPDHVDLVEAAAIPVAYGVAWMALHSRGRLRPHETVLIHAAASGVGLAATQLANAAGATVVALASTPEKVAVARRAGAALAHRYAPDYPLDEIREELGPAGQIDLLLDSVGGATLVQGLSLLRFGGRAVCIGQASSASTDLDLYQALIPRQLELRGLARGALVASSNPLERGLVIDAASKVLDLWCAGRIAGPPIQRLPLEDAEAAHRLMADRSHVGKIVLVPA